MPDVVVDEFHVTLWIEKGQRPVEADLIQASVVLRRELRETAERVLAAFPQLEPVKVEVSQ